MLANQGSTTVSILRGQKTIQIAYNGFVYRLQATGWASSS